MSIFELDKKDINSIVSGLHLYPHPHHVSVTRDQIVAVLHVQLGLDCLSRLLLIFSKLITKLRIAEIFLYLCQMQKIYQ